MEEFFFLLFMKNKKHILQISRETKISISYQTSGWWGWKDYNDCHRYIGKLLGIQIIFSGKETKWFKFLHESCS